MHTPRLTRRWTRRCRAVLPLFALACLGLAGLGCHSAQHGSLEVGTDTPLLGVRLGVMPNPQKAETAPGLDENAAFYHYMREVLPQRGDASPFASVERIDGFGEGPEVDLVLSINMDVQYNSNTVGWSKWPELLTLFMYSVLGFPDRRSSANLHLAAAIYDGEGTLLHTYLFTEPVTWWWDNIYWKPNPYDWEAWYPAYNRLLELLDRDIRLGRLQEDGAPGWTEFEPLSEETIVPEEGDGGMSSGMREHDWGAPSDGEFPSDEDAFGRPPTDGDSDSTPFGAPDTDTDGGEE